MYKIVKKRAVEAMTRQIRFYHLLFLSPFVYQAAFHYLVTLNSRQRQQLSHDLRYETEVAVHAYSTMEDLHIASRFQESNVSFEEDVDVFIGTAGHGHTFPGVSQPFGMVQVSPDNGVIGYDWSSGYHYNSTQVIGFSHTHLSGTGIGELMDLLIMPTILDVPNQKELSNDALSTLLEKILIEPFPAPGYSQFDGGALSHLMRSDIDHKQETAAPGYYRVKLLKHGIDVELTATTYCGVHRYNHVGTKDQMSVLVVDLSNVLFQGAAVGGEIKILSDQKSLEGFRKTSGWAGQRITYFHIKFSKPILSYKIFKSSETLLWSPCRLSGCQTAFLVFDSFENLQLRVGISSADTRGAEKAVRQLNEEYGWDFDALRESTAKVWQQKLGQITISEPRAEHARKIFYTSLYHALLAPTIHSDINNAYTGSDKKKHIVEKSRIMYSTFSLWDTFRAENSLHTILHPPKARDMAMSLIEYSKQQDNLLPVWNLAGQETHTMPGYHAASILAEAGKKKLLDRNELTMAFRAMNATARRPMSDKAFLDHIGYIPKDQTTESVTKTLEYAFDDWCIAQVAEKIGLQEESAYYLNRSTFYKNVFDKSVGFMRARFLNGSWASPFNPRYSNHEEGDFTEGTSWQYTWFVPHDIRGLVSLLGGASEAEKKLDDFFFMETRSIAGKGKSIDITGLLGQYAHGNEPSHHIAYLYNMLGSPKKTQYLTQLLLQTMYSTNPDGLIGNEDCGQMSAWYLFSSIGMYPLNPADGRYHITTPLFARTLINIPPNVMNNFSKGITFEIRALEDHLDGNHTFLYIRRAMLNMKQLSMQAGEFYIHYKDIMSGGSLTIELETDDEYSNHLNSLIRQQTPD